MTLRTTMALALLLSSFSASAAMISEEVFVESPTDTDNDGVKDLIYVSISRPSSDDKISSLYEISPYSLGGTDNPNHSVDYDLLPQDEDLLKYFSSQLGTLRSGSLFARAEIPMVTNSVTPKYATVKAHSLGTGHSKGCPTVGDINETLAAKAVIDWLNGRARGFDRNKNEVRADWSTGRVGMTGVSYNGTLPIMVASTGVEGLKAVIPIAAISNWYDYYRAHGLVVSPGGYPGEDADVLGKYIVRRGACAADMEKMGRDQGRESGDFTPFWQKRNHLADASKIKAATFIIHGQSDWNVKQKHATQLYEALKGQVPLRVFFHRGGHSSTRSHGVPKKIQDWFDHFIDGVENGIEKGKLVEVELSDGSLMTQAEWPSEETRLKRFYFARNELTPRAPVAETLNLIDVGSKKSVESLARNPEEVNTDRLIFLSPELRETLLLSGSGKVSVKMKVTNRKAANLTVALVEYSKWGSASIITRGWADPQNASSMKRGRKLDPSKFQTVVFELEPKQVKIKEGSRLGVMILSTDYEYTLRPRVGTEVEVELGSESFIDLNVSGGI